MNKITVVLLFLLFVSRPLIASDSDTTYGKVRVKKRTSSSSGSHSSDEDDDGDDFFSSCFGGCLNIPLKKRTSSSGSHSSDNEDDDEGLFSSCIGGCSNSCMSSLFEGCMGLIFDHNDNVGVTFSDNEDENTQPSPVSKRRIQITPERKITYPPESPNPVHISSGLGAGGEFYSDNIADAFTGGTELNLTFYPLRSLGLRFSAELLVTSGDLNVDLETDVFVNDTFDGTKTFTETSLFKLSIPLKGEILWVLPTEEEPFFLTAGGGIGFNWEKVSGKESYNGAVSKRTVVFRQWCPALHFGFGFMMPLGDIFFIPEFRYSLFFNDNMHDYQAPGDVAQYTHMFRISLGLCSP